MAVNLSDITVSMVGLRFESAPLRDIQKQVFLEMQRFKPYVRLGMRIAVGVGSRGISNIAQIAKAAVDCLISFGALPFIIPAMGSHGGASAEGQALLLASYGITRKNMGVPILSSMQVERFGAIRAGGTAVPLYMDRHAYTADGVFVINRVKPHTDFHADNESGIAKMLVIGLGKRAQALAVHEHLTGGLRTLIPKVCQAVIGTGKIIGALASVEDGYEKTSVIKSALPAEILKTDAELLVLARRMMPSLPFKQLDVLLVDHMGKNISGTGMDPNIIGRTAIRGERDAAPDITRICLFDITAESHGNALGIGLADLIPKRLYNKINWQATYENVITSRFLQRGFLPVVLPTDSDVINTGISTCGFKTRGTLRLAWIKNTLNIGEIFVTDPVLPEIAAAGGRVLKTGLALKPDRQGELHWPQ